MDQEAVNTIITTLSSGAALGVLLMWRDVALLKQRAKAQEDALSDIRKSLEAIPSIQVSLAKMEGHVEGIGQRMIDFMENCVARRTDNGRRGDD